MITSAKGTGKRKDKKMIDRRYLRHFDWINFGLIITLLGIGLIFVFSATSKESAPLSIFFKKQLFGALIGVIVYLIFSFFNIHSLCRWGFFGYFGILGLLAYTIFDGWIGMGAQRWISLYFINFQPSELVKLCLPLAFTFYFNETQKIITEKRVPFSNFILPLIILIASVSFILKQPDLGTALIILFSGLLMLWLAGIPKQFFFIGALLCLTGAPIIWKNLKPYQQIRVLALMGYGDTKKERYQVEQSKIAIGSGGFYGKGLMKGTQNRLSFLPEARTDFIFSVVCEEWGFIGAMLVLLLFLSLFTRLLLISLQASRLLDQLLAIGLLAPIALSTIINIGMVTDMLPAVGIPLPFFTYGISHLWITLANLGIINNIAMRQFLR